MIVAEHLPRWISQYIDIRGEFTVIDFVVLFLIIFVETGGIVTGFIPGDTILLTVGSIAGIHHNTTEWLILALVFGTASLAGDAVNYWFGAVIIRWIERIPFLKKYMQGEEAVLDRLTLSFNRRRWIWFVVIGRFVPFFRTMVPLLAHRLGLAFQEYIRMAAFASFLWSFTITGFAFLFGQTKIFERYGLVLILFILLPFGLLLMNKTFREKMISFFIHR